MRKHLAIFMVSILMFTSLVPINVYGEKGFDKKLEEAILKVKKVFNISNEYDSFDSSVSTYGKTTNFYLNWKDSKGKLGDININTDEEGNITSYNKNYSTYQEPKTRLAKFSREEGLKIALDFINKVDSKVAKEVKHKDIKEPMYSSAIEYGYEFTRYINNIPYPENNIRIYVNKDTGEVTNYYTNWDRKLNFPDNKDIISIDKAKESYKKEIGLKPMYKQSYQIDSKTYYLSYSTFMTTKAIDAKTGKPIVISNYRPLYDTANMEKEMSPSDGLTPEEKGSIEKIAGILDIKDIEKKAREILKIDDTYKLQSKSLYSNWKSPGDYIWSLYFNKPLDKNQTQTADISLDGKTGELISFYKYKPYNENTKPKVNKDTSLTLAKDYIKKISPDKISKIEYLPNEFTKDNDSAYHFEFIRKMDNVYIENDKISVGVDAVTGEVNSYNLDWYKGKLPSKENIISLDKAYDILFNDIGYELMYVAVYDYEKPEDENKEIKLVYAINQEKPLNISAINGEILDSNGKPYKETTISDYKDIDKSYAKDKIKTLAQYGISLPGDEFKPVENIKQKDFLYLLYKSLSPYKEIENNYDNLYKDLISMGIVREGEKNPERIVTKEEGVKFIIRVMGYDKIANTSEIFKDIFKDEKDISKELKGYMSVAYGLKIIEIDGTDTGNIKPKYELKREDAATMIYNYMFME
ncbi:hypothetical protein KQI42_18405 [Tissierella sp. MSJ-40]|uniref:SLH domain-containing protein n=1 Tax=Tissierella simiarum TaxID=2841534 RepID=A0ABS6EAM7_9FIRM|nr:YcdB/YcdC domain-containing protein [Tissierella simiarum]MBU5439985.1 hypothetical protein [Tissierella simiarum]